MSGVRGSGVEGGLRAVPRGRPAKKKKPQPSFLFNLGEKWKKGRKGIPDTFLYTPKSEVRGEEWKMAEKGIPDTFLYTPKPGVMEPF